jgi:TRAP-type C4-dicarboxylate transport system permease small subunit
MQGIDLLVEAIKNSLLEQVRKILEILLVVFITLKFTGLISWSWGYVLMPLWFPIINLAGYLVVYFIIQKILERN